jgi:hypothetical protein
MTVEDTIIRPFQVGFPGRSSPSCAGVSTRPERETVTDDSQGVRLTMIQDLARYWGTGYDWRKCEARLNDLPQFMTGRPNCPS